MWEFLGKLGRRIDRIAGVGVWRTYLYKRSRPVGWAASAASEGFRWELLNAEKVGLLREVGPFEVSDGLERLRRGDVCYTVSMDGRLAHFTWVQRSGWHPIREAGVTVPVESGEFWLYNGWTAAWARGKGIYVATLKHIIDDHFDQGYRTAWGYTSQANVTSQKGIGRAGLEMVATLRALRVGSHYFAMGSRPVLPGKAAD